MTKRNKRFGLSGAAMAAALAAAGFSAPSQACSSEDYMSSICVMAATRTTLNGYVLANGAQLPVNAYTALFSLIGTTYGGNGTTTFQVPDLRGKVMLGAGTAADGTVYPIGNTGGSRSVTLTVAQMPAHNHALAGATVDVSQLTGSTNLSQVTGGSSSASLTNIGFSASGNSLVLNGNSGSAVNPSPGGGSLATPASPANKIYSSSAPNVAMAAGSISGNVSGTLSGTAPVTLAGTAPTTISGTASVAGTTAPTGGSQPFSVMQPYVALYFYINAQGIYPSFN
jgi:microcystin-dependent protein